MIHFLSNIITFDSNPVLKMYIYKNELLQFHFKFKLTYLYFICFMNQKAVFA